MFSIFASVNSDVVGRQVEASDSESLIQTNTPITRSFSYPIFYFAGQPSAEATQFITWFPNGTTLLSDTFGNRFAFSVDTTQSDFTLLHNSTMIDQRIVGKDFDYDIIWRPITNSDGVTEKYKFDIIGKSANGHSIRFLLDSDQKLVVQDNRSLAISRNYVNSTSQGIGIDWSDLVSQGYALSYDDNTKSIVIPVGEEFSIDPTTISTVSVMISPPSSNYYEGERRVIRLGDILFAFYYDGSNIVYRYSTNDGSSWSNATSASTGTINSDYYRYAVVTTNLSGTDYVALLYYKQSGSNTEFFAKRGTISGTSISWNNATSLFSVTNYCTWDNSACSAAVAATDTNGNIYAALRWIPTSPVAYHYRIMNSTDGGLTWSTSLGSTNSGAGTRIEMILTNLSSGKMLFAYARYYTGEFTYRTFSGSSWSSESNTSGAGMTSNTIKHVSADSDGANNAYVAYLTGGNSGTLKVARWNSTGSFTSFETANSSISHTLPSTTITEDGVIHVYTLSSSKIYDTRKINGTWNAPINPFGTSFTSPNQLTAGVAYPMALWTEGSTTPYNIRFDRTDWDTDKDGIFNNWEINGIDANWDGTADLVLSAADPDHKDIYVEIDYMQFHGPRADARNDVITAFANAPVSNPDDISGITLHLDLDEELTHSDETSWPSGFDSIKAANFGSLSERGSANHDNILNAKKKVYHYNVWVHNQVNSTSSGIAELPGNDFMVSLGSFDVDPFTLHNVGSRDQQAGTLMHELGHNLNLQHGGDTSTDNCKPNYLSVMSYAFQFSNFVSDRPLDYSRSSLASLDENSLAEADGVGTSTPSGLTTAYGQTGVPPSVLTRVTGQAFDWNRDGDLVDTGVVQNINNFGIDDCRYSNLSTLTGYNDWANLKLIFTSEANFADGVHGNVADNEMTMETVRQIRLSNIRTIDYLLQHVPDSAFRNSEQAGELKMRFHDALEHGPNSARAAVERDDIKTVLIILQDLRTKIDGSMGGDIQDDVITDHEQQARILSQLDNVLGTFMKSFE